MDHHSFLPPNVRKSLATFSGNAVTWSLAALRSLPVDVLARNLDIACFTVNATGGRPLVSQRKQKTQRSNLLLSVDLEPYANILRVILDILVHTRWTEAVLHSLKLRPLLLRVGFPVLDL